MNQSFNIPDARLHWNYFLALEKDLETMSRYVEFCEDNLNTYSIEFAHLLLSTASEADTLAKCICGIIEPNKKPKNIDDYRRIIKSAEESETYGVDFGHKSPPIVAEKHKHRLSDLEIHFPRYGLKSIPWASWAKDENPDWWHSYNKVKHERNRHFNKATLRNSLHALAGLLALNYIYCRYQLSKGKLHLRYQYRGKSVTRCMKPESTFIRFGKKFYDNDIAELGSYIISVSHEVDRLSGRMSEIDD